MAGIADGSRNVVRIEEEADQPHAHDERRQDDSMALARR
jgi:hypothetical protein